MTAVVTMQFNNRPEGDPIELPHVGVFRNGETTTLSDVQTAALELHYGLTGEVTLPLDDLARHEVRLNMTGEQAVVEQPREAPGTVLEVDLDEIENANKEGN